MIRAILFDFDGVLTTDKTGTQSIRNYICQETGISEEHFNEAYYPYNDDLLDGKITHKEMWQDLFNVISVSAEIGSGKENELIFVETLHKLGVKADECVFIDNSPKNLVVPEKMGIHVIYFDEKKREMEDLYKTIESLGVGLKNKWLADASHLFYGFENSDKFSF